MAHNYSSGPNNSSAYLSSGRPWLTGSGPGYGQQGGAGLHKVSHGWNDGHSSSNVPGMFRTDGAGTNASHAEVHIRFPYVTKAFEIIQSGSGILNIHFRSIHDGAPGSLGVPNVLRGNHFVQLDGDEESYSFSTRTKEVYISSPDQTAGFQLIAELTGIPTGSMHRHTGSGITD